PRVTVRLEVARKPSVRVTVSVLRVAPRCPCRAFVPRQKTSDTRRISDSTPATYPVIVACAGSYRAHGLGWAGQHLPSILPARYLDHNDTCSTIRNSVVS